MIRKEDIVIREYFPSEKEKAKNPNAYYKKRIFIAEVHLTTEYVVNVDALEGLRNEKEYIREIKTKLFVRLWRRVYGFEELIRPLMELSLHVLKYMNPSFDRHTMKERFDAVLSKLHPPITGKDFE